MRRQQEAQDPHTTFAIVADEETQELLMTIQDDHAVVTLKKLRRTGSPGAAPSGPKTQMADPHGLLWIPRPASSM